MESCELVDSLGICEKCNKVVSVTTYAADEGMNAIWRCKCGNELTHTSFGYDKGTSGAKKIKWVGPDGKWTDTRPIEDFELGKIHVMLRFPSYLHWP